MKEIKRTVIYDTNAVPSGFSLDDIHKIYLEHGFLLYDSLTGMPPIIQEGEFEEVKFLNIRDKKNEEIVEKFRRETKG